MNINLIPIILKDLRKLYLLDKKIFNKNDYYSLDIWRDVLDEHLNDIFYVKYNTQIVGTIISYVLDVYYIDSIGILSEFRNKGICELPNKSAS